MTNYLSPFFFLNRLHWFSFFLSALTKPDSVTNVSLDSIVYDSASPGDKIKLTFSFIPPKGK